MQADRFRIQFKSIRFFLIVALGILWSGQIDNRAEGATLPQDKNARTSQNAKASQEAQINDIDSDPNRPFRTRIQMPEFPRDTRWLNTGGPLRMKDLRGKFVLFDFWTYCCINCIHVLPELKKLEKKYPNELVVIGVHSAKFETEKDSKNITEAILRYEIAHPVINDSDHKIWNSFQVSSWPTMLLVDPDGKAVWMKGGETKFETLDELLKNAIPYYRKKKILDDSPILIDIQANRTKDTPLRFPGKVLADEKNNRLFIADSNHNRIVVCGKDGEVQNIIGSGQIGRKDGGYDQATFDHPQGMALVGETLYVADTENHMLRKVDLAKKVVTTIAGTGVQSSSGFPGLEKVRRGADLPDRWVGPPKTTALNSPWALFVHKNDLFIAMAGPHQIWKMPLDESEIGLYAGNGREDIVDGPLAPKQPYMTGFSSFAQPSGLAADENWLYVADSEGSSIRAVPFDPKKGVKTVVGTASLPINRLFSFGDVDGKRDVVKLQHALGVVHRDGKLYITDTYNNKVKVVDAKTGETRTLAGTGKPGKSDSESTFDEPAGLTLLGDSLYVADTNNHLIRKVNIETGKVSTLIVKGLKPPVKQKAPMPTFVDAKRAKSKPLKVTPKDGKVTINIELKFAKGWKINTLAPQSIYPSNLEGDALPASATEKSISVAKPSNKISIDLVVSKSGTIQLGSYVYFCQSGGEGICKVEEVAFEIPLEVVENAAPEVSVSTTVN